MNDPIVKLLRKPNALHIAPKLDQFQVPLCADACPYLVAGEEITPREFDNHCKLIERKPDRICEPGVRILIDMAGRLAAYEHGERS